MKKILYIDMDNVLVDFPSGISKLYFVYKMIILFPFNRVDVYETYTKQNDT